MDDIPRQSAELPREHGTVWDKAPAAMTAVEHFLSDYSVVDTAVVEPIAHIWPSQPWGTA
jgi:hypothetical protein